MCIATVLGSCSEHLPHSIQYSHYSIPQPHTQPRTVPTPGQTQVAEDVATAAQGKGSLPLVPRLAAAQITIDPVHVGDTSLLLLLSIIENEVWKVWVLWKRSGMGYYGWYEACTF